MGEHMTSPPVKRCGGERWGSGVTTCHPTTTPYRGVGGGGERFPVVAILVGKNRARETRQFRRLKQGD